MELLLLLPYVDVYEKRVVCAACQRFMQICADAGDTWGEIACAAVYCLFREADQAAWMAALALVSDGARFRPFLLLSSATSLPACHHITFDFFALNSAVDSTCRFYFFVF